MMSLHCMRCSTNAQWNQGQMKGQHSRCETISHIVHIRSSFPHTSPASGRYRIVQDLYPHFTGKCENFLSLYGDGILFDTGKIQYLPNCPLAILQSECYCKYTAIVYPTLLLIRTCSSWHNPANLSMFILAQPC